MLTAPSGPHHGDLGGRPRDVEVRADVLRAHDVVGAAVGLARDDGELGHGRLAVGIEELRAVADDAAALLRRPGQEAGHVDERDERDVERVAEAHEARRLHGRVDVEGAGQRASGCSRRRRLDARRAARSAQTMFSAQSSCTSSSSPSSTTSRSRCACRTASSARPGSSVSSSASSRPIGSDGVEARAAGRRCSAAGTRAGSARPRGTPPRRRPRSGRPRTSTRASPRRRAPRSRRPRRSRSSRPRAP